MTSSERRLHPASILFDVARYARMFVWPALLAYLGVGRRADPDESFGYDVSGIEMWLWVLIVPSLVLSVARYLSFRFSYEPHELVVRSGILFRNVRHVPYARIQNLDAVQNVFQRALGVVDVRLETGGGTEPEARLNVLPLAALDEMRAYVFRGRPPAAPTGAVAPSSAAAEEPLAVAEAGSRELLHLPLGELLLCGLLENKGMVLVGAAYGALWQAGVQDRVWRWLFAADADGSSLIRDLILAAMGRAPLPAGGRLLLAAGGVAGFLVLVRLVSMSWALLRLHDFRLTRRGDDLRASFGLLTKVTATIPLRRIQAVIVERGWLHRRLGRASVRVETAGGQSGAATRDREWVAPLVHDADLPALLDEIMPGVGGAALAWQGVHPRAFWRAVKPSLLAALVPAIVAVALLGWRAVVLVLPLLAWVLLSTRQRVRHLSWMATDEVVAFRSGWFTRRETWVRASRIQSVTMHESPFDRRAAMARVRVDTAGAGELSHRIDIPYLAAEVAARLRAHLARRAAETAFRW